MENIFVEFLPPWIETGLQPAFYDKESGTVLQQVARMYAKVNWLIKMFNKFSKDTTDYVNEFVDDTNTEIRRFEHDTTETVNEYIGKFTALKDFVDDYFDNLDVQQEINNKLDDMLEHGTLQEIIDSYVQTNVTWTFDTVSDMAAATNLISGSYAQTLGHTTLNDGGGAIYYITDTADSDEWQESVGGGLYANLVGPLSPENTGLPVDTLINNWNTKKELKFGVEKTYTTTSTITITDVKTYDFHGSTIIYDGTNTTDVINIGYSHNTPGVVIRLYAGIRNLNIDCNSKANNGLHISGGKALKFENIFISNPLSYGLLADNSVGQNWELTLNGIHASATNASGQALSAIKITDVTDSNFSNLYPVNGSDCWLYSKTTWCTYTNIHGYKFPDTNDYTQTQGIDIHGNRNSFDHIIVDTADSIGITNAGQFNVISDIYLYVKAGGTGIKNTGSHSTYRFITVRKALAKIIDNPSIVAFLEVSGIATAKDTAANSYPLVDISLGDNKLPIKFIYDYSANVVTPVRSLLQAVKTITAPATSAEFDLPTMPSADYFVEVVPRTKAIPYYLTRTTSKVTLNINSADLPTGDAMFSIYVKPNN